MLAPPLEDREVRDGALGIVIASLMGDDVAGVAVVEGQVVQDARPRRFAMFPGKRCILFREGQLGCLARLAIAIGDGVAALADVQLLRVVGRAAGLLHHASRTD